MPKFSLRFRLQDRKGRKWLLDLRLPDLWTIYHWHCGNRRCWKKDLSRSKVRFALRTRIGYGWKRLHILQMSNARIDKLSTSNRMQKTMRVWLQNEQTRLFCKYRYSFLFNLNSYRRWNILQTSLDLSYTNAETLLYFIIML